MRTKSHARRSDCPISYALDFIGDKWTLIVLRDLIMVRKRYFQEFLASPERIASNILASRLKQLECAGLITRTTDPQHARRVVYAPTEKALDLLPAMLELVRWGAKHDVASGAPAEIMERLARDRDGLVASLSAPHRRRT